MCSAVTITGVRRHRHGRIEVARGERIGEVAVDSRRESVDPGRNCPAAQPRAGRLCIDLDWRLPSAPKVADTLWREPATQAATARGMHRRRSPRNAIRRRLIGQHFVCAFGCGRWGSSEGETKSSIETDCRPFPGSRVVMIPKTGILLPHNRRAGAPVVRHIEGSRHDARASWDIATASSTETAS